MRLFRSLFFFALCVALALGWGWFTYEPGQLLYGAEVAIHPPTDEPLPARVEILRKSKNLLDSEEFRMKATERLAALQTQRARQLGPEQLVEDLEGNPSDFMEILSRSFAVHLDEISPTLVLSVSSESQPLVSAIVEVIPGLLAKIHQSNISLSLNLIVHEIQQRLTEVEQQELLLAKVLWNLKGKLNAKFADRPISKRGSQPDPSPTALNPASISSITMTSLENVRGILKDQLGEDGLQCMESLASFDQARPVLEKTQQLGNTAANLIQDASALFPLLDSAESMETGPLPDNLGRLNQHLQELRAQRREMVSQTAALIPSATGEEPVKMHSLFIEKADIRVWRVGGAKVITHYLKWSLYGLGGGLVSALILGVFPTRRRGVKFS